MKKLPYLISIFLFLTLFVVPQANAEGLRSSTPSAHKGSELKGSTLEGKLRGELNSAREDFKDAIKKAKDDFKTKLSLIKDERKKITAQKVEEAFNNINKNRTTEFTRTLNRLTDVLNRIETRKDKLKSTTDVSNVETAIAAARLSISNAQSAVTTQSEKDYTITFTGEKNLGSGAKTTAKSLRTDLQSVMGKVKLARQSVIDAFKALKKASGEGKEASGSATPSAEVEE